MSSSAHRIGILVFDGVKMLDVAGPGEVFAEANLGGAHYEVETVSLDGGPVTTSVGLSLAATRSISAAATYDTVIIPGGRFPRLPVTEDLVAAAETLARGASRISSVCTGAFVLAETGRLSGRRAATHWAKARELARLYPDIDVQPDSIWIKDGNVYSSGGVAAGIDLALALVEEDHGPVLARSVARALVVSMRRPGGQSQFSSSLQGPPPRTPILRLVADEVAADPAADWNLTSLATLARVSPRHLTRMFTEELKVTPAQYVERIRFDVARAALDGGMNATEAATRAGFSSYEALRRTFRKRLGVSPIRYQQRFATPSRNGAVPKFRDSWLDDRPSLLIADERVG